MSTDTPTHNRRSLRIQQLRANLCRQGKGKPQTRKRHVASTGIALLDEILPDQGLQRGTLSEWIGAEPGSGATTLAMRVCEQVRNQASLIVVDPERTFYAPAFHAIGGRVDETILIRPKSRNDALWAVEQSLRCPGIGVVLYRIDHLKTQQFRRLQLAAEAGTAVGMLLRPSMARRQPGWADVRLLVAPRPSRRESFCRRVEVRCVYAKGRFTDRIIELELCDETGVVRQAAGLSHSTTALRKAGA